MNIQKFKESFNRENLSQYPISVGELMKIFSVTDDVGEKKFDIVRTGNIRMIYLIPNKLVAKHNTVTKILTVVDETIVAPMLKESGVQKLQESKTNYNPISVINANIRECFNDKSVVEEDGDKLNIDIHGEDLSFGIVFEIDKNLDVETLVFRHIYKNGTNLKEGDLSGDLKEIKEDTFDKLKKCLEDENIQKLKESKGSEFLSMDKVMEISLRAGGYVLDAEDDIKDLIISYGEQIPKNKVREILDKYDLVDLLKEYSKKLKESASMSRIVFHLNSPYKWGKGWTESSKNLNLFNMEMMTICHRLNLSSDINDMGVVEGVPRDPSNNILNAYMHPMELVFDLKEKTQRDIDYIKSVVSQGLKNLEEYFEATIENVDTQKNSSKLKENDENLEAKHNKLLRKAMSVAPKSENQKKIIRELNQIREKLGYEKLKESENFDLDRYFQEDWDDMITYVDKLEDFVNNHKEWTFSTPFEYKYLDMYSGERKTIAKKLQKEFDSIIENKSKLQESKVEIVKDEDLGRQSGYKLYGERYVGAFNPKSADRLADYILLELTDADKEFSKGVELGTNEMLFKYRTETTEIADIEPFIIVNTQNGKVRFMTEEAIESGDLEFDKKEIPTTYLKLRGTKLQESFKNNKRHAFKILEEINNTDFEDFEEKVEDLIKVLGVKNPTKNQIMLVAEHVGLSIDEDDKIQIDKDLILEIMDILGTKLQESSNLDIDDLRSKYSSKISGTHQSESREDFMMDFYYKLYKKDPFAISLYHQLSDNSKKEMEKMHVGEGSIANIIK